MTENRRYQIASGWFLTEEIPDDFFDSGDKMQDEFLENHLTEEYQYHTADTIWAEIESIEGFINFIFKEATK